MYNKVETIALFSIIISVIMFIVLPIEELWYSIALFCFGFLLALIKQMWVLAGFASDKIEELK